MAKSRFGHPPVEDTTVSLPDTTATKVHSEENGRHWPVVLDADSFTWWFGSPLLYNSNWFAVAVIFDDEPKPTLVLLLFVVVLDGVSSVLINGLFFFASITWF